MYPQVGKFIDLIDHGDQIMADRGFLVKEEIMIKRGTLIIPPPAQGAELKLFHQGAIEVTQSSTCHDIVYQWQ
jgi:hypothetical protein